MGRQPITMATKAKLNIYGGIVCQIITIICGIIVPRILLKEFGSGAYGATTSISQFLSYITLLDGGVSSVARAALYKPLAYNDTQQISDILYEIKKFFRVIAYIFSGYVLIIAVFFKTISHLDIFDWGVTFLLVIAISISTFAQYFFGISKSILLQADQKTYLTNGINAVTTVLNAVFVVILVAVHSNLIIVKLVSSCVFILRPIFMSIYVKKVYKPVKVSNKHTNALSQKWTSLGQHIAFFLHSNTDIVVLTIFGNLTLVAIYSVYNMVVNAIQNLTVQFTNGMESVMGKMLAKKETNRLQAFFSRYETMVSCVSVFLFSTALVMIQPFIKIYTRGINDACYEQPVFGVLLILSAFLYCLRLPYHSIIIAAGHFKQTKFASYGEAIVNIVLSIMLVNKIGLIGVAIGTIAATLFRFLFYLFYLSRNLIMRNIAWAVKRIVINVFCGAAVYVLGSIIISNMQIDNYFSWGMGSAITVFLSGIITFLINLVFYKSDMVYLVKRFLLKRK